MRASVLTVLLVFVLAGTSAAQPSFAPQTPPPSAGPPTDGYAFQIALSAQSMASVGSSALPTSLSGGFFAGYKLGRIIVGVSFDLLRVTQGSSSGGTENSQTQTAILFSPGITLSMLRSADRRVEMFGEVDVGIGRTFDAQTPTPPPDGSSNSNFRVRYRVGPGLRFWAAPQFAFGAMVGLGGDYATQTFSSSGFSSTNTQNITGVLAQVQLLGVF